MKKRVSLFVSASAVLLTLFTFTIFRDIVHAEIDEGTYEIEYEMKEADNDNASIADGYFTSPATLTVDDGEKLIRLTVTSADMVKSLSAPTGDVNVVEEDAEEDTRTVKFLVDQELSEPLPLEMHVVVPDLYDTTHTARAVFDVDSVESVSDDQNVSSIENNDQADNDNDNADDNNETAENADNDDNAEANADEDVSSADADTESATQDDDSSPTALWITLAVVGILIIAGILFWMSRKKQKV